MTAAPQTISVVGRDGTRREVMAQLRPTERGHRVEHLGIDLRNWKDKHSDFERLVSILKRDVVADSAEVLASKLIGRGAYR